MDKTAVLHWLQDVEAAAVDAAINDSNRGSLSPNTTSNKNSSPLDDRHHSPSYHHRHHLHSPFEHHRSPSPPKPNSLDTWHVHSSCPVLPSATLTPSSSFQIPEDPGKDEAPEVVKKFLRTRTLPSSGSASHHKVVRQQTSKLEVDQVHWKPKATGIRQTAPRGATIDVVPSRLMSHHTFSQTKVKNQNHSWSPIPVSHPEPVQPTIDLSKESQFMPKRKTLLKTRVSEVSISKPTSLDTGAETASGLTTLKYTSSSSPPKSAPVSPSLSLHKKIHSSSISMEKSLSHSNLVTVDTEEGISDTSLSLGCSSGDKSSSDGQSNMANKGGFSDITSSDGGLKMPCDSGRSSSSSQDDPVGKQIDKMEELTCGEFAVMEAGHVGRFIKKDSTGDVQESCSRQSLEPNDELPIKSVNFESSKELLGIDTEPQECGSNEEELLKILKKWYRQGYGQKDDLARAMRITGHRKSAHELLMEEDLKDDSGQECVGDITLNPVQSLLEAKVETTPPADRRLGGLDRQCSVDTGSPPPQLSSVTPSSKLHPPQTTPSQMPACSSSSSPIVLTNQPSLPVTLLPLSRKKLAELDKVNCFSFDDSSDDILDGRSSSILVKNRNSPLSRKTHSWSLSDYSSSHTSSSSHSGSAIPPSCRGRSPIMSPRKLLGKQAGAESTESYPLKSSSSPLHRGYSVFTVPEESRETLEDQSQPLKRFQESDVKKPPEVATCSTRPNFSFGIGSTVAAREKYCSLREEKVSQDLQT